MKYWKNLIKKAGRIKMYKGNDILPLHINDKSSLNFSYYKLALLIDRGITESQLMLNKKSIDFSYQSKNIKLYCFCLFFLCFAFSACTPKTISKDDLVNYINNPDNGLVHEIKDNNLELEVKYIPTALMAMREQKRRQNDEMLKLDSLINYYGQYYYFHLQLSYKGRELSDYLVYKGYEPTEIQNTFAYGMSGNFNLNVKGEENIPVETYNYIPGFGVAQTNSFLLVFDKNKTAIKKDFNLEVKLTPFGFSTYQANFKVKNIQKIQNLKLISNG